MGDRRPYGGERNRAPNSRTIARRDAERSPRSLVIGASFFVLALVVIGLILFAGGRDEDDPALAAGDANRTSSTTTELVAPSAASTESSAQGTNSDSATSTSTRSAPTTSTAAASQPTATTDEGTTEPTEEVAEAIDPTPTEEEIDIDPVPTDDEPFIGAFGPLPPAQVVSGGLSRPLRLDYELAASLADSPSSAPVYLLEWPTWTNDDVATIATNLGLDGAVEGGSGSFQVFGSTGQIFFNGPTIQYVNTGSLPDMPLGTDADIIASASTWIYASGLVSGGINGGVVVGRDDDAERAVVLFKPDQVSPILSFVPSATVTVGPGGAVIEANVRWPSNYVDSEYGLRSGDALWNTVLAGEGSIEVDLSSVSGSGALTGTMTVYDIWIAYSYAGAPGSAEFLVPLVVFSGEAAIDETGDVVPVSIYVAAVAGQAKPQG